MADLPAAIAAAREALDKLREHDGGTRYNGDDDDAGERACCLVASWKPHDSDCPHAVAVAEFDRLLAALDAAQGEAVAWLHAADRMLAISGLTKARMLDGGSASAAAAAPYSVPAYAAPQVPPAAAYNEKQIAWELERTALGDGFYGNALRVAKDLPGVTADDRALLDKFATGNARSTDHVRLQELALRLYPAPPAAVPAGYALVPVKPTGAMILAGARSLLEAEGLRASYSWAGEAERCFAAMLAAAALAAKEGE